ncbi:hypothetical protein LTR85_001833 [Meristemomyces frigidus]|nr:hypothetical protein LTR85_001833 [Meristemomyces frigidus]
MENSPFAKLGPELRNRIYELAVTHEDPIDVEAVLPNNDPAAAYEWVQTRDLLRRGGIVYRNYRGVKFLKQTQRKPSISSECEKIFYAMNSLVVGCDIDAFLYLRDWAGRTGGFPGSISADNAALMQSIVLDMGKIFATQVPTLVVVIDKFRDWLESVSPRRPSLDPYKTLDLDFDLQDLAASYRVAAATVEEQIARSMTGHAQDADLPRRQLDDLAAHIRAARVTAGLLSSDGLSYE